MDVVTRAHSVREHVAAWRRQGDTVGFVQTMGCIHKGHLALIAHARTRTTRVVVSIFVNPLQFDANEDFGRYPRTIEHDKQLLEDVKTDLLFTPTAFEMYPTGFERSTRVDVPELSQILEGQFRPGHFEGVATITTKLLQIVQPDVAVVGEKDFQQSVIQRRLVTDLCMPLEVATVPVVRDHDGLAFGARNRLLSTRERHLAPRLHETLKSVRRRLVDGERNFSELQQTGTRELERAGFTPEYCSLRQPADLMPPRFDTREIVILGAVRLGRARLVDCLKLQLPPRA